MKLVSDIYPPGGPRGENYPDTGFVGIAVTYRAATLLCSPGSD